MWYFSSVASHQKIPKTSYRDQTQLKAAREKAYPGYPRSIARPNVPVHGLHHMNPPKFKPEHKAVDQLFFNNILIQRKQTEHKAEQDKSVAKHNFQAYNHVGKFDQSPGQFKRYLGAKCIDDSRILDPYGFLYAGEPECARVCVMFEHCVAFELFATGKGKVTCRLRNKVCKLLENINMDVSTYFERNYL